MTTEGFAANPVLRDHWFAVAAADQVSGHEPTVVTLLGERLVVWRGTDGVVVAAPDRCPHREAPLSLGRVDNGALQCRYHGWEFGSGGRCTLIPSSGVGAPIPTKAHLPTLHTQECYGLVWLCLGTPAAEIPVISHEHDRSFRRINNPVEVWTVSAPRMADNFMDISHFPWVHLGTFGRAQDTLVPRLELEPLDDGWFGYRYEVEANNPDAARSTSASSAAVLHRVMSTGFTLPLAVRSTIRYETGLEHILLLLSTPIDSVTSYFTFVVWRNDDFSTDPEEIVAFDRAIGAEDRAMLQQIPGELPLDLTATVSAPADKPSVEWRRRFAALLAGG